MKIGDKVRFLNETGGGILTGFQENGLVTVLTEDGFEFPVLRKEVIVVTSTPEDFEQSSTSEEKVEIRQTKQADMEEVRNLTLADYMDLKKLKEGSTSLKPESKLPVEEVDLHIQNILTDYEDLSSGEILDTQIARFTTALDGAIKNEQKKIIFIHGKGAGKLKYEMQKILTSDYPKLRFQDASFKEYGFGATLVIVS